MNALTQLLDAVKNAEPVIILFKEGTPGDKALYADVIVPRNYVLHDDGVHRHVPDAEVETVNVMDRRGDWRLVRVDDVAGVQCI